MSRSFNKYLKKLQELETKDTLVTGKKVVLLISGSSHYQHAELSEIQKKFFTQDYFNGYQIIDMNFPYNQKFKVQEAQFPSLFQASLQNIGYFFHTIWNRRFKQELIRHLAPVFKAEEVVIISQSSGLNMLTQVLADSSFNAEKCQIIALGPVSYKKLDPSVAKWTVIKGTKDYYSTFLDSQPVDYLVSSNHFDYLENGEVGEIIYERIQKNQD
ncbi:hypothetical protein ACWOFR_15800 [Carnobacterium gallinarum]|uniref:hypothetical protein n=1 Tax=Carnobacterium gallinarum TaxID=2749 RepID=UPI000552012A|nr:hypothetical protein [Carnobacterium gallinarum]